ncbi:tetratricopeptide repeat protein [Kamptonema cortianum]|nr:tetratricopeptide repeat protein [Oscillatoria laete-virens]MDK3159630.1 tetratricopeptide repeat protein [Kamptonema cortianum]MDL5050279.1 tetratricopeptide repeat protein [Oscillatoria amoena NRMC-F 0135]MDL5055113.1 tetratricopeptide repeat protein [Oscillatoria laete-virens NRMC-F 0139]
MKPLITILTIATIFLLPQGTLSAEDMITRANGQIIRGEVTQVFPDGVSMRYLDERSNREVTLKFFYRDMKSLQLNIPASYEEGMKLFGEGKYQQAIEKLDPIVTKYKGAIDPRVGIAMITLADAYVAMNNLAKAGPIYDEFAKLYPSEASRANVGLAKIANSKGQTDKVMELLADFEKLAAETKSPNRAQERAFSEAFFILGQAYEQKKDYSKALECYLKSAVLYSGYQEMAAQARAKADALRKTHNPEKQTPVVFVP